MAAGKRCNKCGELYGGFGETCSSCRKASRASGSTRQCVLCGSHFWGFGGVCDSCDPFQHEGYLRFTHEDKTAQGFCRVYHSRIDVWSTQEEAECGDPPAGSMRFCDVVSWNLWEEESSEENFRGGFTLNFGAVKKKVFIDSREEYIDWARVLFVVLSCPAVSCHEHIAAGEGDAPEEAAETDASSDDSPAGICGAKKVAAAKPKLQHFMKSTVASRQLKDFALPVELARRSPQAEMALDHHATGLRHAGQETRERIARLVEKVRTRLIQAALTTHRVGHQPGTTVESADWAHLFQLWDKDHSGLMNWTEFLAMCRKRLELSDAEAPDYHLRVVFQSLDVNNSGEVEQQELVAFVVDPVERMRRRFDVAAHGLQNVDWKIFFRDMDKDHSGTMSWSEFEHMCREKLKVIDADVQLHLVFDALDADRSGQISVQEFISFIKNEVPQGVQGAVLWKKAEDARKPAATDPTKAIHQGWLHFEHQGNFIRGYCRLFKDRLDAWQDPASASRGEPVEGSILFSDVVGWKIHRDVASGKVSCDSISLYCGPLVKQVQFDTAADADAWSSALRQVLMPPLEHGTFQAWKPPPRPGKKKPGGGHPEGQHHLSSTKASRAPLYKEVQLANMKGMFLAPVYQEDLKKLDAEARHLVKDEKSRKQVVATITAMRTRIREAAWTAGGSDWVRLFRAEDKDHSGRIDWDEFRSMCRRVLKLREMNTPDAQLRAVFQSLDIDHSGVLDFEELVAFVEDPVRRMRTRLNAKLGDTANSRDFFDKQDKDKSGDLDWEEFEVMCRKKLNIIDDESQLAIVFEALDTNDDGYISAAEFLAFVQAAAASGLPGAAGAAAARRPVPTRRPSGVALKPQWT